MVGIYQRKKVYWLQHTVDGERFFENLHTRVLREAMEIAKRKRGKRPDSKPEASDWEKAISKYLADKKAGHKPSHLGGKSLRSFRLGTAKRVASVLSVFAARSGAPSPSKVTQAQLQKYYDNRAVKSKAGARSTIATIQAFLDHVACLPGRVVIPQGHTKLETRQPVRGVEEYNDWIEKAPDDRLKFALYCGFHCGLRKGEIQHSRAKWFNLTKRVLTIPGEEKQVLPSGLKFLWKSKDGDTREIPIPEDFTGFLKEYLQNKDYCMPGFRKSKKKDAKWLYDFRVPFESYSAERGDHSGKGLLTIHGMRHSWITHLCNCGDHTLQEVVAWSGDTIETIEKNYWKKVARTGATDASMKGQRKGDDTKAQIAEILALMKSGKQQEAEERLLDLMPNEDRFNAALSAIPGYVPKKNAKGQIVG